MKALKCPVCDGEGQRETWLLDIYRPCRACGGSGIIFAPSPDPVPGPESVTLKYRVLGVVKGDSASVKFHGEQPGQTGEERDGR